jgi:hypothetical protein
MDSVKSSRGGGRNAGLSINIEPPQTDRSSTLFGEQNRTRSLRSEKKTLDFLSEKIILGNFLDLAFRRSSIHDYV